MFLIILEYFWLITALFVGLGNAVMFKLNSSKQIVAGNITRDETNKLIKWWLAWVCIPCIALWILQASSGQPLQVDFMSWKSKNKFLAMALMFVLWMSLLIWVFIYNGAFSLIKLSKISSSSLPGFHIATWHVKMLAIIVVISGVIALFLPRT